ncbi:MAG: ComF family protein [Paludibacteraceae bacterium]|nr:ComF family protein [Paludibacteraceae bacterium]
MKNPLHEVLNLFYPDLCIICGETLQSSEHQICLACIQQIPRTHFQSLVDNPVEKRFWGKVDIYRATSFYYFHKGSPFQKLIHELKYKGNKEIGEVMGRLAALEMLESPDFSSVDFIIPVPLHPKKLALRGYNQSECIARGLSDILRKPIDTHSLVRVMENTTQTRKSVFERFQNTSGIFEYKEGLVPDGSHLLLVDDVLTTGSTLEAAVTSLSAIPGVRISIFTLAVA